MTAAETQSENPDLHELLVVSEDATTEEIKEAYKKMALKWHPDRHLTGKEEAAQKFIEGHKAYRRLMHEARKRRRKQAEETTDKPEREPSIAPSEAAGSDMNSDIDSQCSLRHSSAGSDVSGTAPGNSGASEQGGSSRHSIHTSLSGLHSAILHSDRHSSHRSDKAPDHISEAHSASNAPSTRIKEVPLPPMSAHSAAGSHANSDRSFTHSEVKSEHSSHSKGNSIHTTHSKPRSERSSHSKDKSEHPSHSEGNSIHTTHSKPRSEHLSHSKDKSSHTTHPGPRSEGHSVHLREGADNHSIPAPVQLPESSPKSNEKLRKKPKPTFGPLIETEDYVHIVRAKGIPTSPNGRSSFDDSVDDEGNTHPPLCPVYYPRSSSGEWLFPLELSLEELYEGTALRFRVTRRMLTQEMKTSWVAIDIPPGTRGGMKIRCPGVGHERKVGGCQDVVFVIEEKSHDRFYRVKNDLCIDVFVPYVDRMAEDGGDICIRSLSGAKILVNIPYPIYQKSTEGKVKVEGAGMPSRKGRGDLIVRWQIVFPLTTKWDSIKKVFLMHR